MKKTLLSVVLCVAVLLSTMSAMLVMPASAASSDLLAAPMAPNNEGATFTAEGGVVTFNAAAAGDELGITPESALAIATNPYIDLEIDSPVAFDIAFYDKDNNKWMFAAGDFCYNFGEGLKASEPIPAGKYSVRVDLSGAYTWTGDPVPANADLDFVSIVAKGTGAIKVSKMLQSDGMTTTTLDSASFAANAEWKKQGMLNTDPSAWGSADAVTDAATSSAVIAADGSGISVSATAGLWPAATLDYASPIEVDWATTAIEVSYSIWSGKSSRLILFYGDSTNANFDSEEYVDLSPVGAEGDLPAGHYVGTIMLKDIIPESSVVDGKVKLNGIKAFAVGEGKCVTVNALNVCYVEAANDDIDTGIDVTEPTVPQGGNPGTTTNPSTGDNTNTTVFVVIALVAAAVVTLSVVSKKVTSR